MYCIYACRYIYIDIDYIFIFLHSIIVVVVVIAKSTRKLQENYCSSRISMFQIIDSTKKFIGPYEEKCFLLLRGLFCSLLFLQK